MKEITAAGKRVGNIARSADEVKKYVDMGSSYIIVGAVGLIMNGARQFPQKAREA